MEGSLANINLPDLIFLLKVSPSSLGYRVITTGNNYSVIFHEGVTSSTL